MPRRLLPASLLVLGLSWASASIAFAQDQEPDHFDKMIGAVQERRARSLEQVMSAPGAVDELWRHTDVNLGFDEPRREAKPIESPFVEPDEPWLSTTELVAIGLVGLGAAGFWFTRRLATR